MKIIEKDRVKVYDDEGKLIEERNATFEDLLDILAENYIIEIVIESGQQLGKFKKKEGKK
ncbi:MAG: hypothetical protein QXD16_04800 [Sulfolobales archaeon]